MAEPLSRRALNRALLERQHLLARDAPEPLALIQHLYGVQAQEPWAPYVCCWDRIADFDPLQLSELIESKQAVRGVVMRATVHLFSAADAPAVFAVGGVATTRGFRGSPFSKQLGDAELDDIADLVSDWLMEEALTRAEIRDRLTEQWPDADPTALGYAATYLRPLVQVPPRGLWRQQAGARWIEVEAWLGCGPAAEPPLADYVRRYLAAYGPATVKDMQAYSGLTKLRAVVGELGDELVRLVDEDGRELFDVRGAPLPDPETPAPPRLLAPFENVLLAHDDRSRIISRPDRKTLFRDRLMRAFLVDGFMSGTWSHTPDAIELQPLRKLSDAELEPLAAEAGALLAFLEPGADPESVRIGAVPKG